MLAIRRPAWKQPVADHVLLIVSKINRPQFPLIRLGAEAAIHQPFSIGCKAWMGVLQIAVCDSLRLSAGDIDQINFPSAAARGGKCDLFSIGTKRGISDVGP